MTPQEKCVSLETAKKLKEAGFPQETERLWEQCYTKSRKQGEDWKIEVDDRWRIVQNRRGWFSAPEIVFQPLYKEVREIEDAAIAAPDAQEIGEQLPSLNQTLDAGMVGFDKVEEGWETSFSTLGSRREFANVNEAEARAACWLWLKENKLI